MVNFNFLDGVFLEIKMNMIILGRREKKVFFFSSNFTGCGYSYHQSQVHESDGGIIKLFLTLCLCKMH